DNLWLLTCPLLSIPLMELLKRRQRYSLHAAGVCIDGAGVVMPGSRTENISEVIIPAFDRGANAVTVSAVDTNPFMADQVEVEV
ncbi:hypothetical protein C2W62_53865, partial [Candidatus Entotheonella serta]